MSERVSASSVWKKWLSKVRKTPKKFTRIPRSELDEELCAAALECSPRVYKYIPGDLRTDAVKETAASQWYHLVREDPERLDSVPGSLMGRVAEKLVTDSVDFFEMLPESAKTRDLTLLAVRNGVSLRFVPERHLSAELIRIAVEAWPLNLEFVPGEYKTPQMCARAVEHDGACLAFVPESFITRELCLSAVTGVGGALASVPVKFRDREICLTAVKNDVPLGRAWKSVPECLRDGEMCLEAIRQNSSAIEIVPKEQRVPEMCLKFLAVNGLALESIPKKLRSAAYCTAAVKSNAYALDYVPEELRTRELCLLAIDGARCGDSLLRCVPKKLRDGELCRRFVEKDGTALAEVPGKYRSEVLCALALRQVARREGRHEHYSQAHQLSGVLDAIPHPLAEKLVRAILPPENTEDVAILRDFIRYEERLAGMGNDRKQKNRLAIVKLLKDIVGNSRVTA